MQGSKHSHIGSCLKSTHIGMLCWLVAGLLASCQGDLYYTEYKVLPQEQWDSRDTLVIDLPVSEQDIEAKVTLGMRRTHGFRYKKVVMREEVWCQGKIQEVRPVTITLRGNREEEGTGLLVKEFYSDAQPLHLQAGLPYSIRLTHQMRLNPLDGIVAVGVTVEK